MKIGRVVISKSGRDKGSWFVVLKIEGQDIYIADGKIRKIENPKKKNQKHLQQTDKFLEIREDLTNKSLKKMILKYEREKAT